MLEIFFSNYFILIYLHISGLIFLKLIFNEKKDHNYIETFFFGFISLSFLSLFVNFFFPLSKLTNTIILLTFFIIFFFNFEKIFSKKKFCLSIIITFTSTILLYKSNIFRPDAGLYHIPFIKILNEEKIIFGLSNIHFRFGHISITQYLSAHLNNYITNENAISIPNSILASAFIIYLFNEIKESRKFDFYFFFIFFSFLFSILYLKRYSEYGNDAPGFIFSILTIINYLKYKNFYKQKRYLYLTCFFATYAFFIKSFLIVILLIPFFAIYFKKNKKFFYSRHIIFLFLIISLWFTKNIINTGCLLYPVPQLCIKKLSWTDINKIKYYNLAGESASKGYLDKIKYYPKKEYHKNFNNEIDEYINFNQNFNWFTVWAKYHLKVIINKIILFLLIMTFYLCFYRFILLKKLKRIRSIDITNEYKILFFISFSGLFFWFLKFPLFRYGVVFIYLIIVISLISFIKELKFNKKILNIHTNLSIVLYCIIIISLNSFRIIKNISNDNWPNIYKMGEDVIYTEIILNKKNSYNKANSECMYGRNLCTNEDININFYEKNGYKFFTKI
jgi:hypothetical protein